MCFVANIVSQFRIQEVLRDEKPKAIKELSFGISQAMQDTNSRRGFSKNRQHHTATGHNSTEALED
jgi:hypothetical protein